jgi:hypothetical protein
VRDHSIVKIVQLEPHDDTDELGSAYSLRGDSSGGKSPTVRPS